MCECMFLLFGVFVPCVYVCCMYVKLYCINVYGCILAIIMLYVVIGKEERLWPIVKLINQSINQG